MESPPSSLGPRPEVNDPFIYGCTSWHLEHNIPEAEFSSLPRAEKIDIITAYFEAACADGPQIARYDEALARMVELARIARRPTRWERFRRMARAARPYGFQLVLGVVVFWPHLKRMLGAL